MLGSLVQCMLLMGVIYWYSKGMMSLINDCYRSEFQRKLQASEPMSTAKSALIDIDNSIQFVQQTAEVNINKTVLKKNELHEQSFEYVQTACSNLTEFLKIMGVILQNMCITKKFEAKI